MPEIVDADVWPADDRPGALPGAAAGVVIRQPDAQQLLRDGERLGLQRAMCRRFCLVCAAGLIQILRVASIWPGARLNTSPMRQPVSSASRSASAAARLLSRRARRARPRSRRRRERHAAGFPAAAARPWRDCARSCGRAPATTGTPTARPARDWPRSACAARCSPCHCSMALRVIARGSPLPKCGMMWRSISRP